MAIEYELHQNNLTTDPMDRIARVNPSGSVSLEKIIDEMIGMGSTVVRSDILSVLEDYYTSIVKFVVDGKNVNTPMYNFSVSIKGVFTNNDDLFDKERHLITCSINPGERLRDSISEIDNPVKIEVSVEAPKPGRFIDFNSGEENSILTSQGTGQITGHHLKFDHSDPNQGIFFIASDQTETRVEIMCRNKPGDLIFNIPELAPGDYELEVRTLYNDNEIRKGRIRFLVLTVS